MFHNQPEHPRGAVRYRGGQGVADAVEVDLARVEPDVDRVVVCASADGAGSDDRPVPVRRRTSRRGAHGRRRGATGRQRREARVDFRRQSRPPARSARR
ncbi:TerD family protein [Nocardia sp. NPDC004573]